MKLKFLIMVLVVVGVSACETKPKTVDVKPVVLVEPPLVQQVRQYEIDKAQQFSNQSVIYYPLDKPASAVKQKFPEYRSVLDNTTAGGYTVFDPSVTVYALDGQSPKPDYLPEYSVPQHAAQYWTNMILEEKRQAEIIPPMPTSPSIPEYSPRKPRLLTAYE